MQGDLPVMLNRRFLHINSRWLKEPALELRLAMTPSTNTIRSPLAVPLSHSEEKNSEKAKRGAWSCGACFWSKSPRKVIYVTASAPLCFVRLLVSSGNEMYPKNHLSEGTAKFPRLRFARPRFGRIRTININSAKKKAHEHKSSWPVTLPVIGQFPGLGWPQSKIYVLSSEP